MTATGWASPMGSGDILKCIAIALEAVRTSPKGVYFSPLHRHVTSRNVAIRFYNWYLVSKSRRASEIDLEVTIRNSIGTCVLSCKFNSFVRAICLALAEGGDVTDL